MKTVKEILKHIDNVANGDFFGVTRDDLIDFLPYKEVKQFLKEGVTAKEWKRIEKPLTKKAIVAEIKNYMSFAWEKANNCRGLSADRSIDHMRAYLWLLDDGGLEEMEKIEYEHYGKEQLIFICERYKIDWKQWDDGIRTNHD